MFLLRMVAAKNSRKRCAAWSPAAAITRGTRMPSRVTTASALDSGMTTSRFMPQTSVDNLQPVQAPDGVARHQASGRQRGNAWDRRVDFQVGGLGAAVTSHSRMVLCSEPEARRPSGSMHSPATGPECPSSRAASAISPTCRRAAKRRSSRRGCTSE